MKGLIPISCITVVLAACAPSHTKVPVVNDLDHGVNVWTTNDSPHHAHNNNNKAKRNPYNTPNPKYATWGFYDEQGVPVDTGAPAVYKGEMGGFFNE